MRVIKFETKWMPFLSDVFAVVIVMILVEPLRERTMGKKMWFSKYILLMIYEINYIWTAKNEMKMKKWSQWRLFMLSW